MIRKNYKNLIGGDWLFATDNANLKIFSPIDGSLIGTVPAMSCEDIDYAMNFAKNLKIYGKKHLCI